ncbi:MAG: zf-HC2 domain-containing protein [candidate division Zixibacteria bacterium]|nr:zf-HC2 domain-containing protein [candidate division Zixibacteria bacterium]
MNCEQYRELISARVDGEIESEELDALEAHLEQCPECAAFARQVKQLQELAADSPLVLMPSEVEEVILSRSNRQQSLWRRLFSGHYRIPRPLAWAAALLLVFLSVNSLISRDGSTPSEHFIITPEDSQPVQHIVLTRADIVQTYTTGSTPAEL